jgi:hypothetical protein
LDLFSKNFYKINYNWFANIKLCINNTNNNKLQLDLLYLIQLFLFKSWRGNIEEANIDVTFCCSIVSNKRSCILSFYLFLFKLINKKTILFLVFLYFMYFFKYSLFIYFYFVFIIILSSINIYTYIFINSILRRKMMVWFFDNLTTWCTFKDYVFLWRSWKDSTILCDCFVYFGKNIFFLTFYF